MSTREDTEDHQRGLARLDRSCVFLE